MDVNHTHPLVAIVDQQADVRNHLTDLIQTLNYDVRAFVDAKSLLGELGRLDFACVILEMYLPDETGMSVLKRMKQHEPAIPVIMLSSDSEVPDAVKAMQAGCVDFVEKPFVDRVMVQKIQRAVNCFYGDSCC